MRAGIAVCVGVVMLGGALASRAALTPVLQSDFLPGAQVVTFETGSTGLPSVPGMAFLSTSPSSSPYYGGSANFNGFFGAQGWSNVVSLTYSDLGVQFLPNVQAVGGWVGRIPNFNNEHASQVVVHLYNSLLSSLGTATITLPPAFNSPVFFGFQADQPIARFRMTGNGSGFFSVDNFTFRAVPEPSTSMFAVVSIGASLMRRARR